MSVPSGKSGFTLIESLLALSCMPVLLILAFGILKVMSQSSPPNFSQVEVLELQLRQSLNRASDIQYYNDQIMYSYNNQTFTIEQDGNRLVRVPGYEILLTDLKEFKIIENKVRICDEDACVEV